MTKTLVFLTVLVAVAGPALGDWVPGDPYKMHFPQLPDVENGMNVLATEQKILADDFMCTATGPITDIHIWASWLGDEINPLHVDLYLFSDIPASQSPTGYSMPGELLWARHFHPTDIVEGQTITSPDEPFYNPNTDEIMGTDNIIVQYNFFIDPAEAMRQEEGRIYWLGVQKRNLADNAYFGWKTAFEQWNDDAVWGDLVPGSAIPGMMPPGEDIAWNELIDPRDGVSLDLAFVITPEPASMVLLALGGLALMRRR